MKNSLIAIALALFTTPAFAMYYTPNMTCQEVQNTVKQNGAVILHTGRYTYDRFVAHRGYCQLGELTKAAWVSTLDEKSCWAGYKCKSK